MAILIFPTTEIPLVLPETKKKKKFIKAHSEQIAKFLKLKQLKNIKEKQSTKDM